MDSDNLLSSLCYVSNNGLNGLTVSRPRPRCPLTLALSFTPRFCCGLARKWQNVTGAHVSKCCVQFQSQVPPLNLTSFETRAQTCYLKRKGSPRNVSLSAGRCGGRHARTTADQWQWLLPPSHGPRRRLRQWAEPASAAALVAAMVGQDEPLVCRCSGMYDALKEVVRIFVVENS